VAGRDARQRTHDAPARQFAAYPDLFRSLQTDVPYVGLFVPDRSVALSPKYIHRVQHVVLAGRVPAEHQGEGLRPGRLLDFATAADTVIVTDVQLSPEGGRWPMRPAACRPTGIRPDGTIWLVSADGGPPRWLTTSELEDSCPRWSPGGTRLAFLSDRRRRGVALDWSRPRRPLPGDVNRPGFHAVFVLVASPDGEPVL
jgi:hypothetical protein